MPSLSSITSTPGWLTSWLLLAWRLLLCALAAACSLLTASIATIRVALKPLLAAMGPLGALVGPAVAVGLAWGAYAFVAHHFRGVEKMVWDGRIRGANEEITNLNGELTAERTRKQAETTVIVSTIETIEVPTGDSSKFDTPEVIRKQLSRIK